MCTAHNKCCTKVNNSQSSNRFERALLHTNYVHSTHTLWVEADLLILYDFHTNDMFVQDMYTDE